MTNYYKDNKKHQEEKDHSTRNRIIMVIILIIIILLLITSCSCTSKFWGKIGDWFKGEGNYTVEPGTNDPEQITNQELKFDKDFLELSLSDINAKLGFSYKNISPNEFACTTSDADIATCYVVDDYVVINPKAVGEVIVTLKALTNGKTYEATAKVQINDATRYISLSSKKGTINLAYGNKKTITYKLVGLTGEVKVSTSDKSIATATVENGIIKITGHKVGTAEITVSIDYNGKTYTEIYKIKVIDSKNDPNYGVGDDIEDDKLDSDSSLKSLTTNKGTLNFDPNTLTYYVGVSGWTWNITLKAEAKSPKATITYTFNGETVDDLNKLKLKTGDNVVTITVTAEDGSKTTYTVIINKAKSSNDYLKNITTNKGTLSPKFNKNTLDYKIDVDYKTSIIDLEAIPKSKKATLTYTFNGVTVDDLSKLNLLTGPNVVKITVTAEDGSTRTYRVVINKAQAPGVIDNNSRLSSLTDSLGKIDFDPFVTDYNIGVSSDTDRITLNAIPSSDKATVKYTYNGKTVTDLNDLELAPGDNKVVITVIAEDGSKTTYTVNINKATETGSTSLSNLEVLGNAGKLKPNFNEDTLNYEINVDKDVDKISLRATPKDTGSKLTYTFNGQTVDSLKDLELQDGPNRVVITVTDKDGLTRDYTVVINKESNKNTDVSLKDLTVDGESIIDTFQTTVDSNKNQITIVATPNDPNAKVSYIYNGVEYKDVNELKMDLKTGPNVVQVVVTAEDGITKKHYEAIITKEAANNVGVEIKIDGTIIDAPYEINVDSETDSVKLSAIPVDKNAKIIYNGKEYNSLEDIVVDVPNFGENKVSFTVVAEDGTEEEYTITINKKAPVYEIKIKENEVYYLEDYTPDAPYYIKYDLYKDGKLTNEDINASDISIDNASVEIVKIDGENLIKVTPNKDVKAGDKATVTIKYQGTTAECEVKFDIHDYTLNIDPKEYDLNYSSEGGNSKDDIKTFIVGTKNLFTGDVNVTLSKDKSELTICSKDKNTCINVVVPEEYRNYVEIEYTGELTSPSSLPIKVVAKENAIIKDNIDNIKIDVTGTVYGKTIKTDDDLEKGTIDINLIRNYVVTIDANEGIFGKDELNKDVVEIKRFVKSGTNLNLNDVLDQNPMKEVDCLYYKFLGFSTNPQGDESDIEYTIDSIIENITADMKIYAIYSDEATDENEDPIVNWLNLNEIPLFKNPEGQTLHGSKYENLIYPGATGSYKINLKNDSEYDIVINKIMLKEETICVDTDGDGKNDGCLNMGYIFKADPDVTNINSNQVYYYGSSAPSYDILNQNATSKNWDTMINKKEVDMENINGKDESIKVPAGGTLEMGLLWKWVEENDTLDTKVGNYAATTTDTNINNLYKLTIRLGFYFENDDVCQIEEP